MAVVTEKKEWRCCRDVQIGRLHNTNGVGSSLLVIYGIKSAYQIVRRRDSRGVLELPRP